MGLYMTFLRGPVCVVVTYWPSSPLTRSSLVSMRPCSSAMMASFERGRLLIGIGGTSPTTTEATAPVRSLLSMWLLLILVPKPRSSARWRATSRCSSVHSRGTEHRPVRRVRVDELAGRVGYGVRLVLGSAP